MIHSSSVAGHHFLMARRRGYDPAEVDAVMKRLVATLQKYEEREADRTAEAEAGSVADLAEIRLARSQSEQTSNKTEDLYQEAVAKLNEARLSAAETLAAAQEQADSIIENARADAATLSSRRNERSEALITSALSEVKTLRSRTLRETNEYRATSRSEAASLLRTAELTADEILEQARHEAGSMLGRARREHAALEKRLAQLRSAIAGIEGQFRHLAESTLEQTEIVSSMISLETDDLQDVVTDKSPEVVRLTQQGKTIDLTDAESEDPVETGHADERFAVMPGSTIYQRRGGGVRRRLEEEYAPTEAEDSTGEPAE